MPLNTSPFPANAEGYKIQQQIGAGASATVYRALCESLNIEVAIKVVDLDSASSSMDEIRKELQVMSSCNHSNIVTYYVSFVHQQSLWLVMPLLLGSLRDIMKAVNPSGLDEISIATILREVLKSLDYLHKNGQIHRDIKAGNILLDERGSVYVGDFGVCGLSVEHGSRQKRNTFVGTPCWMAPEVIEQSQYTETCDIWSLGITAIELAHGVAPLAKFPPMKVIKMTLQNPPPTLDYTDDEGKDEKKRWSRSFREFVAACLTKNPEQRPSATSLLSHRFIKNMGRKSDYLANDVVSRFLAFKNCSLTSKPEIVEESIFSSADYSKPASKEWDFGEDNEAKEKPIEEKKSRPPTPRDEKEAEKKEAEKKEEEGVEHRGRFKIHSTPVPATSKQVEGKELPPKCVKNLNSGKKKDLMSEKIGNHMEFLAEHTKELLTCISSIQGDLQGEDSYVVELERKNAELTEHVSKLTAEVKRLRIENEKQHG
ncbi:hypothetical protein GEMRC1_004184 [Eukaryota sp. GEM-RC1]